MEMKARLQRRPFQYIDPKICNFRQKRRFLLVISVKNGVFCLQFPSKLVIIKFMRRLYYQKLQEWLASGHKKPLMLRGVRQCGKTYLLKLFGESAFPKVHYFNFEKEPALTQVFESNLNPQHLVNQLSFYQNNRIDIANDLVIFDEIQVIPKALTSLKYFQEEMPELAICCAGSLLGVKLSNESYPVGKIQTGYLYPLTFVEFLRAIGEDLSADLIESCNSNTVIPQLAHERIWERLKWYFIVGGLPEVVQVFIDEISDLFVAFNKVREKQAQLISDYYADIAKHSGKINAMHIDRVWRSIPSQLARAVDGSSTRYQFHGIVEGIDRYSRLASAIDWLDNAGLIFKVPIIQTIEHPLSAYVNESRFKLYVFDVGILGALSHLAPKAILDYQYGTYKGYFAENFIAQEFVGANCKDFYAWQEGRSEIEFVREIDCDILPIEVKSGNVTHAKSLQRFIEKFGSKYRTIMSGRQFKIDQRNGIHNYPLYLAGRFPVRD
ncbi:MAG: ATP-binding protein [Parachlamydiaceae bacterium]